MPESVSVTTEIAAPPEKVYAMVADLTRMGEWSPENTGATWLGGATGAAPGARFKATNSAGKKEWSTTGAIVEAVPGRVLSFRVTAVGAKVALWAYRFEATDGGCAVTESWVDERNAFIKFMGKPVSGVADRATHNRAGMEETLRNLKAAAEG
jgi:uncharacterized protein YndB with AHSA1/START domain